MAEVQVVVCARGGVVEIGERSWKTRQTGPCPHTLQAGPAGRSIPAVLVGRAAVSAARAEPCSAGREGG